MGNIYQHRPVLLLNAVISRYEVAFDWALQRMTEAWGEVALQSDRFDFVETEFYQSSMGDGLMKQFYVFQDLVDPATLADRKIETNKWESEYLLVGDHPEERPLNLDPGYITEAKLVLATTKDRDHRLYLRDGIFAEVTLHYHKGKWCKREWTYPDYQRDDFHDFFSQCRGRLRELYGRN